MKKIFIVLTICLSSLVSNGVIAIHFENSSGYDGNADPEAQFIVQLVHNGSGISTNVDSATLLASGDTLIYTHTTATGDAGTFDSQGVIEFDPPTNSGVIFIRIFPLNDTNGDFGSAWVVASSPFTEYDSVTPGTVYSTGGVVDSPFFLGTSGTPVGMYLDAGYDDELPISQVDTFYECFADERIVISAIATNSDYTANDTYQWIHNDYIIPSIYGGTDSSRTLEGNASYNGSYSVLVSNDIGTTTNDFIFQVFEDSDGDGISDGRETYVTLTDPSSADSDNDGINDGLEINNYQTDPLSSDSDLDYFDDLIEVNNGLNPLVSDQWIIDYVNTNESLYSQLSIYSNLQSSISRELICETEKSNLRALLTECMTEKTNLLGQIDILSNNVESLIITTNDLSITIDLKTAEIDILNTLLESNAETMSSMLSTNEALEMMRDLRVGSQTFGVSNGTATIRMYVDESSDLTSSWTNTQHVLEVDIPADADTKFYRFRMD